MQIAWPWPTVERFSHGLITFKTNENANIKLLDLCEILIVDILLSTLQMSPNGIGYKQTWYPPDVRQWWETFTKLFLSNIINHGESDVQWQISI